jgi:lipid-A-disaccharide synthase
MAGTPFVMVYTVSPLTWAIGRRLVTSPHYAMVNLIAQKRLVAELVQEDFTPVNVATELRAIIAEGSQRQRLLDGLRDVRQALCPGKTHITAAGRAALAIEQALRG